MPPLQALVICKSVHHRNTAAVAGRIADILHAVVVAPEDVPLASLGRCNLVGIGSGVYYGGLHPALFAWLQRVPESRAASVPAFVFSTSGLPCLARLWHAPLKRLLVRKGFEVVGEFACRGYDTWGPLGLVGGLNRKHPDDRDLGRAEDFARRMAAAVVPPPARALRI